MPRKVILVELDGVFYLVEEARTRQEAQELKVQVQLRFLGQKVVIRTRSTKFYPELP